MSTHPTLDPQLQLDRAKVAEAEQIFKLQFLCYQSEAACYDDYQLPPLRETLAELLASYDDNVFLVVRNGDEVVASVRARLDGDSCEISRLIVHPRLQRRGIGSWLLGEVERRFPFARRFELFTGHLSAGNLALYERLGYRKLRESEQASHLTLIHLEKWR